MLHVRQEDSWCACLSDAQMATALEKPDCDGAGGEDTVGIHVGVATIGGSSKWMVYFMENPIKMDDLEVPPFQETTIY